MKNLFHPTLVQFCESVSNEFDQIPDTRKESLRQISAYILGKRRLGAPARITVICTHNSRRSHIAKAWLQVAALWYGIYNFESYSGGTKATAFHPNAVETLGRSGIELIKAENGNNPVYLMRFGTSLPGMAMYSKHYEDSPNPMDSFCALIVCSDADTACPTVIGAEARIYIPYEDPKNYDDTELAAQKYDERTRQIAREMFYALSVVNEME
ncbi:MAG TPA: protein-tyrosine-phosphatase [Saprospiraceae bacterium]|nr:protein-tyrosine-phosphatase [Saprospiraceae bacterium]